MVEQSEPDSRRRWDCAAALAYVDGDSELLHDLIEIWFEQGPGMLAAIREAVAQDDGAGLAKAAHYFKGSLQILRAEEMLQQAAALEKLGQGGELESAASELEALEIQFAELNRLLHNYQAGGK